MAVPVGYEAFQSLRRKGVTLLCFLLASSMAIGITLYVDSYSIHDWNKNIDIGDIAMSVEGSDIESYVDEIRDIPGVTRVAALRNGRGNLVAEANGTVTLDARGNLLILDSELLETFPNYITIQSGRLPLNSSEIAVLNSLKDSIGMEIGDVLTLNQIDNSRTTTIVGFYSHQDKVDFPYYWQINSVAIVTENVVTEQYEQTIVLIDVDRSPLSAFYPAASLRYLNGIEETIRKLSPYYIPGEIDPELEVVNRLASGIFAYMSWVQNLRITQMSRASSVIFLLVLVTFLTIRHNVNERRFEENMLISRGAMREELEKVTTREVFTLSLISCFVGIPIGLLLSRVAIAATGFFKFDPSLALTEPMLISLDSLIISTIVTIILPMLTLGGYRVVYSTKKIIDEDRGRLAKLVHGIDTIHWDVLILGLSALLMVAMFAGGSATSSNATLMVIFPYLPIPLFLGVSSLSMKVLRYGANGLSSVMRRIVGEIPAYIGVRRVGKGTSSAGATVMILVLAICLSWNSAIIDSSIPVTARNQSRLKVGADLTFALNNYEYETWNDFITNVTNHDLVESGTLVSEVYLYLSSGYEGETNVLAVNPSEYVEIGYDYLGIPLNESDISTLFERLEDSPDGAIITSDLARAYDFAVGDILRATTLDEGAVPISFKVIGITAALPEVPDRNTLWSYHDLSYSSGGSSDSQIVGTRRILINRDYLGFQLTLHNDTYNYYCVRTNTNANASAIAEDIFNTGGKIAVYQETWEAVSQNVNIFISRAEYRMDRSLDTMLTVLTIGTIVGGFTIYAVEGVRTRRRETALLRSLGAPTKTIILTLTTEMLVLMLFSMILLAIYAPLFLATSLNLAGGSTTGGSDSYLITIFPVIPWSTIFIILGFFLASMTLFVIFIAILSSRINLASTLNAAWAEAGPYGGDM